MALKSININNKIIKAIQELYRNNIIKIEKKNKSLRQRFFSTLFKIYVEYASEGWTKRTRIGIAE